MSVADAASSGDRLRTLKALRDRLAGDIDRCESKRDLAALSQRLMDVLEQIADCGAGSPAADGGGEETGLSEFERRLRERESPKAPRRTAKES